MKNLFQINAILLNFLIIKESLKSIKILSSTTIFKIDNKKMVLKHQIRSKQQIKHQHIRTNGCWKFSFAIREIDKILKYNRKQII